MTEKVAAIGTFDGVHRGHRAVLEVLKQYACAKNLEPVAITFKSHPLSVISPDRIPDTLTPLSKKKKLLFEAGANPLLLEFNDTLRKTTASSLMKHLYEEYNVKALVVGYDNTFGSDGINLSLEDYKTLGKELGIEVVSAPRVPDVSSSAIRKAIKNGDMEKAREMLGRPYSITAVVEKGNSLGHTIGFPTANIDPPKGVAIPKPGVYAALVRFPDTGVKVPAMVNIGSRPTVRRGDKTIIEAHLINWEGNLYGKEITIRFLKRLRDEHKFESIEALQLQLAKDLEDSLNCQN